ncbi:MAG TPA: 2'-5' RNA ligase family protein [Micromonosporaceae bacterium]|nr:2'-5' RNA ligase family protein [Micromonosporaceae bacterium]
MAAKSDRVNAGGRRASPAVKAPATGVEPSEAFTVGVAISIPAPFSDVLDAVRASSGDPLAPFIPAHLTLLGPTEIDPAGVAEVEVWLGEVAARHAPFRVHLRGTGTFRPVTEVVFVAVAAGISECERLASDVRRGPLARDLHYPYHPHVTIAHDVPTAALDRVYAELNDFEALFTVDQFTLYVHGADGRWRPLRDFKLTAERFDEAAGGGGAGGGDSRADPPGKRGSGNRGSSNRGSGNRRGKTPGSGGASVPPTP